MLRIGAVLCLGHAPAHQRALGMAEPSCVYACSNLTGFAVLPTAVRASLSGRASWHRNRCRQAMLNLAVH